MSRIKDEQYVTRCRTVAFRVAGQAVGKKRVHVRVPAGWSEQRVKRAAAAKALKMVVVWV